MEFKICPKCSFENPETVHTCTRCGRSLGVEPVGYAQAQSGGPRETTGRRLSNSQWAMLLIVVMMAVGSVMYRLLVIKQLEQTSVLFIGIPAVLAAIVIMTGPVQSAVGVVVKGITICLLMSGILLGEGFICIVMASPLGILLPDRQPHLHGDQPQAEKREARGRERPVESR